jgi:predicted MFS family arabinose efflux permease
MSVGGLWTFAAAVGRKLVDEASGNRATSIIIGGISVGTVVGVPLGSILGSVEGWRFAFYVVSFLCFCVLIAQAVFLPKIINSTAQTVKGLLDVFRNKGLILAFAAAALAAGGHFTAYTYLEPHLVDAGADAVELAWLLALYGAAGVAGTFIGERLGTSKPAMGFFIVATAMAVSILMTVEFEGNLVALAFAVGLWGLSFGAVPVCVQIWTYATDPERFETSSALTVSVFQIALAAGSFLGGTLVNNIGVPSAFFSGASLNLLCAVVLGVALFRQLQTRIEK